MTPSHLIEVIYNDWDEKGGVCIHISDKCIYYITESEFNKKLRPLLTGRNMYITKESSFAKELKNLLNYHSVDAYVNTSDKILANFLVDFINAYALSVKDREKKGNLILDTITRRKSDD